MKKKIAVFANGWTTENLSNFLDGLQNSMPKDFADTYLFLSFSSYGQPEDMRTCEGMAHKLPDLKDFDAAIVFGPGLNFPEAIDDIFKRIDDSGIPAISIGIKHKGLYNISADNFAGMRKLCDHLIEEHNVKSIAYIAGPKDNEDSNERLLAIQDSLSEHNLSLSDEYLFYSNWEAGKAHRYVVGLAEKGLLPDAIICANDFIATALIIALEDVGVKTPDNIIITGFDNTRDGQIFYPSLTTVNQQYYEIGRRASSIIDKIFNGGSIRSEQVVSCSFIPGDSCGCHREESIQIRNAYTHSLPQLNLNRFHIESRMSSIEQQILSTKKYEDLIKNLSFLSDSLGVEGDSFFMTMDPSFKEIGVGNVSYPAYQFAEKMDVIVGKIDSKPTMERTCDKHNLLPGYTGEGPNRIFGFIAIYYGTYVCGYMAMGDCIELIRSSKLVQFETRINRLLVSLHHTFQLAELNARLSDLMEQDTLTRVKNRNAYEKFLKKLEADFIEGETGPFCVIYFDINNLKKINDMYGHEKGDAYIKNSSRLICTTFKHSPVFRIGGDEFVVIAENEDYNNCKELLKSMNERMASLKAKGNAVPLTERISIASGVAEYDRTLDNDFNSIFRRADELMYENKYRMKNDIKE